MLFPQLKDKVLNFWTLQFTGWSLYWIHILTIASLEYSLYNFKLIVWTLLTQLLGFFTTCFLRLFYKKLDYRKIKLVRLGGMVLLASIAAQNLWFWADKLLDLFMSEKSMPAIPLTFQEYFRSGFYDLLLMLTWSILYFVIKIWKEWDSQRRTTNGLMIEAQAAQLQMLRSQLNPHFLFNSLASIRALIDEDENNSRNMISDLSAFLRYSLVERNDSVTTLENEINAIKYYLSIEKRRYEEKLEIEYFIEDGCEHCS